MLIASQKPSSRFEIADVFLKLMMKPSAKEVFPELDFYLK
jgi:hypothetical protein